MPNNFDILQMLTLIYEEMDVDAIESKFVDLVTEIFAFEKVGLFFVKHGKGVLQGKLCRGFAPGQISTLAIPVAAENLLTRPLVTGFPVWNTPIADDPDAQALGLRNFAAIPIVNKKRIPCWKLKMCLAKDCPAYGNRWLRCWLVPRTQCSNGKELPLADRADLCSECKVFTSQNIDSVEGILLVDNPPDRGAISNETITLLAVIAHSVGIAIDNSKLYSKTLSNSIMDTLTGLHNRRYFDERFLDELARSKRHHDPLSLLFIDLDHFKKVNDTYCHPVGDQVLQEVGKILRDHLRHTDVLARYGGEEFAVLLLHTDKEQARLLAEQLRVKIAESRIGPEACLHVTCSLGVASYGDDATSLDGLLSKADQALYLAKTQGRNRVGVNPAPERRLRMADGAATRGVTIVLTGYRATGKTTVGRLLAVRCGLDFIDMDQVIATQEGRSIREMVASHGWEYFRAKERQLLLELADREPLVIASGGGAIQHQAEWAQLKKKSLVVWLTADSDTICRRLEQDPVTGEQRPALTGQDLHSEVATVLAEREPLYRQGSHLAIDAGLPPETIVEQITAELAASCR